MNRKQFLHNFTLGSACMAASPILSAKSKAKPNILFIFADDQCNQALGAIGGEVQTPNLDKLVAKGTTFTNAYNQGAWNGAVCMASRAMLNCGRFLWHAHKHGRNMNSEREAGRMWSQYLNKAGYDTYMTGKWHVITDASKVFGTTKFIRPGMPRPSNDTGYNRPKDEKDYKNGWKPWDKKNGGFWKGGTHWSKVVGDTGIEFLEKAKKVDKPFFMYLAFNAPHDPRQSPKEYVDKYPVKDIKIPKSFIPEYPYKDAIGCSKRLRDEKLAPFPRTKFSVKVNRQEYYAIITHMDDQIGRILDALKKSGKADNTYIFFTADHGLAVGRHGLIGKQNMFEHSMKPPLIVCGPDLPKGKRITAPVYMQDIMPTTLELAGVKKPDHVDFKSLLPIIKGEKSKQYDAIYGGYLKLQRMVRKDNYKLIYYPKIKKTLLFDLDKDPCEMTNLADNLKYKTKVKELIKTFKVLQKEVGDTLKIN